MTVAGQRSRLDELSRPRGLHPDHIVNRVSLYWVDSLPLLPSNGRTKPNLTARQEELGKPKRSFKDGDSYCDPLWPVKQSAMTYDPSPRILDLARHKTPSSDYKPPRSAMTQISDSALSRNPTPRVEELAKHKKYVTLPIITPQRWDWSDWDRIPPPALKAQSSERLETLSAPKRPPQTFRPARSCIWPVGSGAKTAETSERVVKLSQPKPRSLIKDDYDPYHISKAALRAQTTQRLLELAEPPARRAVSK